MAITSSPGWSGGGGGGREVEAWLGGVRVTPRFRAPLERELAG